MRTSLVIVGLVLGATVAQAEPKMLKGPYLQDLAPTSITVMWQLDEPRPAKLVVTGPGGEKTVDVGAGKIAEARIEGLTPASRYTYRVELPDGTKWTGELATAPALGADVPFSFIIVGDSRGSVEQHRRVVERMAREVPDFVIGTGDMVDDGNREDQWQQFFDVENQLLRDNVYFPTLGNHDRQGRGRTADTYRAYFSVPENGNDTERYYGFTYGSARFLVLDSNEYSFALTDQTSWIERELIAARQDKSIRHIFVTMHHPPYSISLHGGNRELRERWTPLFDKYGVSAVFSGHDHVYERAEVNGLRYFVSGGGGASLYPLRPKSSPIDVEAVKKFERVLHYLRVSLTGDRVEVTAIRADGTTIEVTTWTDDAPRAAEVAPAPPVQPAVMPVIPAAGAPAAAAPRVAPPADDDRTLLWVALIGAVGILGAAVFVVRALR